MFNCQICKKTSKLGEKSFSVVIETKLVQFPFQKNAHKFRKEGKIELRDDPGGSGQQITRELQVCRKCKLEILSATT